MLLFYLFIISFDFFKEIIARFNINNFAKSNKLLFTKRFKLYGLSFKSLLKQIILLTQSLTPNQDKLEKIFFITKARKDENTKKIKL